MLQKIINDTLWISSLVFVMMLLADYINTKSRGKLTRFFERKESRQYTASALLGAAPGCSGSFLNSSFFIHGNYTFGALLLGMFITTGDEAFVMLSLFPEKTLLLITLLTVIGIGSVLILKKLHPEKWPVSPHTHKFAVHQEDHMRGTQSKLTNSVTPLKIFLVLIFAGLIAAVLTDHLAHPELFCDHGNHEHGHSHEHEHHHSHEGSFVEMLITAMLFLAALIIIAFSSKHYLQEHIQNHLIKKHFPQTILWVTLTLFVIYLLKDFLDIEHAVNEHLFQVFLMACFIGLIPISGPHMGFSLLFAQGAIPFWVLLCNSIVQDGHGLLPLMPHAKRDVFRVKIIKLVVALAIGVTCYSLRRAV